MVVVVRLVVEVMVGMGRQGVVVVVVGVAPAQAAVGAGAWGALLTAPRGGQT